MGSVTLVSPADRLSPLLGAAPRPLGARAWPQVPSGTLLVVAVGSTEQHGHHLPLATDTLIAEHLAQTLCQGDERCVLGPTIPFGASGEHQSFPGTLSIGHEALELLLIELVRSATETFAGVVFVNGHGGNEVTMRAVTERCHYEARQVLCWSPMLPAGGDHHAGHTETSVMLAIHPALVGDDRIGGPTMDASLLKQMIAGGTRSVSASGVIGDPNRATAEVGHQIVTRWSDDLRAAVEALMLRMPTV
jgi:mycofactocin precursor peptide peptidase